MDKLLDLYKEKLDEISPENNPKQKNNTYEWKNLANPKRIEMTVGMPLYKSRKIIWLALEGLRNQKNIDFGWELIIFEENGYSFDIINKFIDKFPNCQRVNYVHFDNKKNMPLSTKWISIAKSATSTSKILVMQDSDDYSPNKRLYIHREHFKNRNCILSTFTKGIFYNIKTSQTMIYNNKNNKRANLLNAVDIRYIKKFKDPKIYRLIFTHFFQKINTVNIFQDTLISQDNWKTGFFTDGYNTITIKRRVLYDRPITGYMKCRNSVMKKYPGTVLIFLMSL